MPCPGCIISLGESEISRERKREQLCEERERKLCLGLYLKKNFQNPNSMMMVRLIFFGFLDIIILIFNF